MRGIKAAIPGREINVIGRVIQSYARRFGYGVVRDFTGHGIGRTFHSGLVIPHYDAAPVLQHRDRGGHDLHRSSRCSTSAPPSGRCGTTGGPSSPQDRRRSAQFEHTILITETGNEILTLA